MFLKRKHKERHSVSRALKKIGNSFHTEDIFWRTEVEGNLLVSTIMIAMAILLVLVWIGTKYGILDLNPDDANKICGFGIVTMMIPAIVCRYFHGEKRWLKYQMLIGVILVNAIIDSMLSFNVPLIMILGIILSIRYFSHVFTMQMAALTSVLFTISAYCSCRFHIGSLDMNFYYAPEDTLLKAGQSIYLHFANSDVIMPAYVKYYMLQSYMPKFFLFSVASVACVKIAKRAHNLVLEQAKISAQKARIELELNMAAEIQTHVLPTDFPAFPDQDEFDLYASLNPARQVGGDFYDFFFVDDVHLAVVIADVSGKGVPAALFMMTARTLIRDHMKIGMKPSEAFCKVNDILCENNTSDMFVTAWMGILDTITGELTFVNAGHNPPLVKLGENQFAYLKQKSGFVLAGMEGYPYREGKFIMQPGDRLFLYTDGVTEATDKDNHLYGNDRLAEFLNENIEKNGEQMLRGLRKDVQEFVGEEEQFDDITMLILDFHHAKIIKQKE